VRFRDAADQGSSYWRLGTQKRTANLHNVREGEKMEIESNTVRRFCDGVFPTELEESPVYRGGVVFHKGQRSSPLSILYVD